MTVLLVGILLTALLLIVILIKASRKPQTILFEKKPYETRFQQNGRYSYKSGIVRKR